MAEDPQTSAAEETEPKAARDALSEQADAAHEKALRKLQGDVRLADKFETLQHTPERKLTDPFFYSVLKQPTLKGLNDAESGAPAPTAAPSLEAKDSSSVEPAALTIEPETTEARPETTEARPDASAPTSEPSAPVPAPKQAKPKQETPRAAPPEREWKAAHLAGWLIGIPLLLTVTGLLVYTVATFLGSPAEPRATATVTATNPPTAGTAPQTPTAFPATTQTPTAFPSEAPVVVRPTSNATVPRPPTTTTTTQAVIAPTTNPTPTTTGPKPLGSKPLY